MHSCIGVDVIVRSKWLYMSERYQRYSTLDAHCAFLCILVSKLDCNMRCDEMRLYAMMKHFMASRWRAKDQKHFIS